MFTIIASFVALVSILVAPQIPLSREIFIQSFAPPVTAREIQVPPFETKAKALAVYDAKDNTPIIEYGEDTVWPIASLTKMMAALVFFDQNPDLQQSITLEKDDMIGGGMILVPAGTTFTAEDLIHATLMVSANNTANALYKATSLSLEQFIEKMNERAESLGLKNTRFADLSGLNPDNVSTPQEYAKVMNAAMTVPNISTIMKKTSYTMKPVGKKGFLIGNTNKFLQRETDFDVSGAKTGLLNESGFNVAVQANKNGKEVVGIVFGEGSFEEAFQDAQKLLDKAFEKEEKREEKQ